MEIAWHLLNTEILEIYTQYEILTEVYFANSCSELYPFIYLFSNQ